MDYSLGLFQPLLLTFDPNFQGHPDVFLGADQGSAGTTPDTWTGNWLDPQVRNASMTCCEW